MEGRNYLKLREAATQMGYGRDTLYALAAREDDPLPLRSIKGMRNGFLIVPEFDEWLKRNTELYKGRS